MEGGKQEYPAKKAWGREENQQQTPHIHEAGSGNRARALLVGDECLTTVSSMLLVAVRESLYKKQNVHVRPEEISTRKLDS